MMGNMKRFLLVLLIPLFTLPVGASEAPAAAHGAAATEVHSPLTTEERALEFDTRFLKTDDHGAGFLLVEGEPLSVSRLLSLSPWDLMELIQTLSGKEVTLSRFGNGDELTQAWRLKVAAFAASADAHHVVHQEDLFDPALVLWDPGYIQNQNSWGQWTIRIGRRDIVQGDLATLSPLEVQQAVEVLTARTYPVEFILEHLEAFRAQLSVMPRLIKAVAPQH